MVSFPILLAFLFVNTCKLCVGGNLVWQNESYALYSNQSHVLLNKGGGNLQSTILLGLSNQTLEVQSRYGNVIGGQIRNTSLGQASGWFNLTNQSSSFTTLNIDNNMFILVWHGKIDSDTVIFHQKFNNIGQNISKIVTLSVKIGVNNVRITNLTSGYVIAWYDNLVLQSQQYTWDMEEKEQVITIWNGTALVTKYYPVEMESMEMSSINDNKFVISWVYTITTSGNFVRYQLFDGTKPSSDIIQLANVNNEYALDSIYAFGFPNGNYILGYIWQVPSNTHINFYIFDKNNESVKNFTVPICFNAKLFLMGPPGSNNWMLMCVGWDNPNSSSTLYDVYGNYYSSNGEQIGQTFKVAGGLETYMDASVVYQDQDKSVFAVSYITATINQEWLYASQYTMTYNNKKIIINKNHKLEKQNEIIY